MAVALDAPHFEVQGGLAVCGEDGADFLPGFHLSSFGNGSRLEIAVHGAEGPVRKDDGLAGAGNFKRAGDRAAKDRKD